MVLGQLKPNKIYFSPDLPEFCRRYTYMFHFNSTV